MPHELLPMAVAVASLGPAIGLGLAISAFFNAAGRQPEVIGKVQGFFFVGAAFIELLALLAFAAFFLVLNAH
jgi:F-type H+-transporting ATPase subunit c